MKKIILVFTVIIPFLVKAQDCGCIANYKWLKETFEQNDAGFQYVINQKGKTAYDQHNKKYAELVKNTKSSDECYTVLSDWLTFFRKGHLSLSQLSTSSTKKDEKPTDEDIIESFKDWDKLKVDVTEFTEYLKSKKKNDFEGVWVSEPYKIGVKKVGNEYLGFIIEADGVYWREGQIKLRIKADEKHSSTFYMRDHSAVNFDKAELLGDNYMQMGFISYKRLVPKLESNSDIENYFKVISADDLYFELLNKKTTLLRIPSFNGALKSVIDSVINANKSTILKTPNLIIDIRNNGGGSDRSYGELLPLIYTNPIRTVGVELLSTKLNNQRMLNFVNDPKYKFSEKEKKWAKESYDKLSEKMGEFVSLNEHNVSVTKFDKIHKYPENVGIIINENNGSTAEQFLLAAKQSKKVKLFGTTTYGVLDISNMYFVKSPCKNLQLGYSLSRSMRIPEMTIDGKGIQPDYYIDKEVPKYNWIKYVTGVLEE